MIFFTYKARDLDRLKYKVYIHVMKHKTQKIDLTSCPSCIGFNIRKAMRAVSHHYDQTLAPSGLRGTQFAILTVLREVGETSVNELSSFLVMDRTTLTRNLKPLENDSYVKITIDPEDRRTRRIQLTSAGKKILKVAMPYWQEAQNGMVSFMGETNAKQLISILRDVATVHD